MGGVRSSRHTSTGVDTVYAESGIYRTHLVDSIQLALHPLSIQQKSAFMSINTTNAAGVHGPAPLQYEVCFSVFDEVIQTDHLVV